MVVVYATVPVCRVVAEFSVRSVIRDSPDALWRRAGGAAGIERKHFSRYFDGKAMGYAIEIGKVRRYRNPRCPFEQFGVRPPQSFLYLSPSAGRVAATGPTRRTLNPTP